VSVVCNAVSDWRCLVAFRGYSWSSREVVRNGAEISCFYGPPNFARKGPPNFWPNFIPSSHECRNEPECRRNEISKCILWQSKCILKLLTEFRVHSKYSGTFLWLAGMFCSCSKLSRCIRSEKITNCIRSAFELHSYCILNSLTAFQQHSKYSGLIRGTIDMANHFKSCQNIIGPTFCTNSSNMAGSILR